MKRGGVEDFVLDGRRQMAFFEVSCFGSAVRCVSGEA
jgi:hypothetical protein